ncbi:MAG: hypothetical protein COX44_00825 [Candidatus Portnoybacteria bacterium CG23_combo_of_CG06-09_8_20_14_all_37_13]|uniref:Uncharacterized protein n=1 Tax=Candidatus Portnoybacteria bacterium CG23_combo_of_CG06-09_8_20_14_all_37_13 TaxID=1974819 RepID=A0A2G9YDH0_9BACT|nr:MAG: hypothetical protein COX44_00825 [Candidatus Portnoybacteria bacterium CG23_combo_of_CG06-09_8_20_14_all_37_13]
MLISQKDNIIKIQSKEAGLEIGLSQAKINDFVIKNTGEYEIKNIFIEAISHGVYVITLEDVRICFLNKNELTDKELEAIDDVDILITDDQEPISEIEPSLVIFKKDIDKIAIKKKDLPREGTKIWKP